MTQKNTNLAWEAKLYNKINYSDLKDYILADLLERGAYHKNATEYQEYLEDLRQEGNNPFSFEFFIKQDRDFSFVLKMIAHTDKMSILIPPPKIEITKLVWQEEKEMAEHLIRLEKYARKQASKLLKKI